MFCVIYEFKIHQDKKDQFIKAWSDFTKAIYQINGSLGSRLHATNDPSIYVAYAQWPSEEKFDNAAPLFSYTEEEQAARKAMTESTVDIKVLHKLNMIEDLLK